MTWEIERYDWAKLGAVDSAAHVPSALIALCEAQSREQAEREYWRIDNHVMLQGSLFEASLPTASCAVIGVASCTDHGLNWLLELLVQIAHGYESEQILASSYANFKIACLMEISKGYGWYLANLRSLDIETVMHCVDLVGYSSEVLDSRNQAISHLLQLEAATQEAGLQELIKNWIEELCKSNAT
ncbi:MAG: hypothetical protein LC104_07670 [Bacteroidales bacterium]|nr:hypothetical protein [Bacteroidales bacterium]